MSTTTSAASSSSAAAATSSSSSTQNALASLTNNFGDFLGLLMTQLKNQDPTAPLDANSFTTELVQFAGVEQQINTNTSLTQLIQATQGTEIEQATQIVGKQVAVTSTQLALQGGSAAIQFSSSGPQPVEVSVFNSSGTKISDNFVQATTGSNTWTWNGETSNGVQMPDGGYTVTVTAPGAGGSAATAMPFAVVGTVTGVQALNNQVNLKLGGLSVNFSAVQQVL